MPGTGNKLHARPLFQERGFESPGISRASFGSAPGKRRRASGSVSLFYLLVASFLIWQTMFYISPTLEPLIQNMQGLTIVSNQENNITFTVVIDPRIWAMEGDSSSSSLRNFRLAIQNASHGKAVIWELPSGDTAQSYRHNMFRLKSFYSKKRRLFREARFLNNRKRPKIVKGLQGVVESRKFLQKPRLKQRERLKDKENEKNEEEIENTEDSLVGLEASKLAAFRPANKRLRRSMSDPSLLQSNENVAALVSKSRIPIYSAVQCTCHVQANAVNIRSHVNALREKHLPLLASLVQAPNRKEMAEHDREHASLHLYWTATFSLCDITWRKPGKDRKRIPEISDSSNWKCNGQPATVIENGCPSGSTIIVQCPQGGYDGDGIVSNITFRGENYKTRDLARCELDHPLVQSDDGSVPKIVASVLIYHVSVTMLLEWMEYHRLIGVDHFWVYVMEDDVALPNLDHVTYIPWNLNPSMVRTWDIFLFQTAAQLDSLHRARRVGTVEWIMYLDLDEFLAIRRRVNDQEGLVSLPEYLQLHVDNSVDAVQMETVTFGSIKTFAKPLEFQLNYTWRAVASYGTVRCKTMVRPSRVDYYNIHWVTFPKTSIAMAPIDTIWIHHYKTPQRGVFVRELAQKEVIEDTEFRDLFAADVQVRVLSILSSWIRNQTVGTTNKHNQVKEQKREKTG